MRKYYHIYPTCPNCHEPHVYGEPIRKRGENTLKCDSCGVHFRETVNLSSSDKFSETVRTTVNRGGEEAEGYLKHLPLGWRVRPNRIEREYIDWVKGNPEGKFLITWPWNEVKFIPLLATEYIFENPDRNVAIVGRVHSTSPSSASIYPPGVYEAFDSLVYMNGDEFGPPDREISREKNKFGRIEVMKKRKVLRCRIHRRFWNHRSEEIRTGTLESCKKALLDEMKEIYGEGCIRKMETVKLGKGDRKIEKSDILHEDGIINLKIEETREYTGDLKYNAGDLWKLILNSKRLHRVSRNITHERVKVPGNTEGKKHGVIHFISTDLDPEDIFHLIEEISPDVILIQDTDEFIRESIYGGEKYRALSRFLREISNTSVLMFSTDRDMRHLYGMYRNGGFVEECGITPHTWDSEILLDRIGERRATSDGNYPNLVSSSWSSLEPVKNPPVEYAGEKDIDRLDEISELISESVDDREIVKKVEKFTQELKGSPLYPHRASGSEMFERWHPRYGPLSYDHMMASLHEEIEGSEHMGRIKRIIERIYLTPTGEPTSPLMKRIIDQLNSLTENPDIYVTLVVHGRDVRGTEKILSGRGFQTNFAEKISVCSWRNLTQRENHIPSTASHIVVSTLHPSIDYSLHTGKIDRLIFVGSEKKVGRIKTIVENRLTENISRPVFPLSDYDSAPYFLRKIQGDANLPPSDFIGELTDELMIEYEETSTDPVRDHGHHRESHPRIKPGESAILVIDSKGRGMFLPRNTFLFIKEDGTLNEKDMNQIADIKLEKELKNREILVGRESIYRSFRSIFTKVMMEYGSHIPFKKGPYEWKGFGELYHGATEWIHLLERALEKYSLEKEMSFEDAGEEFSRRLAGLNLTASDPDYIRSWWSDYESVKSREGMQRVFKIEHPKSLDDLRKIYGELNSILSVELKKEDAERCYSASILMQQLRRDLLRGEKVPGMYYLHKRIQVEVKNILETSPTFRAGSVLIVQMREETEPFRIMDNYRTLVDNFFGT